MSHCRHALQVLRDWFGKAGHHRRLEAEGGDQRRGGPDHTLQAREPEHVRVGDPQSPAGRRRLHGLQRAQRQLHQQVPTDE